MFYANTYTLKMKNKKMATKALEVMKEALAQVNADAGISRVLANLLDREPLCKTKL